MKMGFLTSGIFWGILLVLIGLSIILKLIFGINFPVFRVVIALALIYWGVVLMSGISFKNRASSSVVFGEGKMNYSKDQREYNTFFGKSFIDLTGVQGRDVSGEKEFNVIFGRADIIIDDSRPLRINAASVFGAIDFPDETVINFGSRTYKTTACRENEKCDEVKVNVVFGSVFIRRDSVR